MASNATATALTLFPLQAVLFPGGLLSLKVFEPRHVDLVTTCLREQRPFGVVALKATREARRTEDGQHFETTGTLAELIDVDSERSGILQVRCHGVQRFVVLRSEAQADGLWQAETRLLPHDALLAPPPALLEAVRGLASAIASLKGRGSAPFLAPHRFDDALGREPLVRDPADLSRGQTEADGTARPDGAAATGRRLSAQPGGW